jgi:hypothetical protein
MTSRTSLTVLLVLSALADNAWNDPRVLRSLTRDAERTITIVLYDLVSSIRRTFRV